MVILTFKQLAIKIAIEHLFMFFKEGTVSGLQGREEQNFKLYWYFGLKKNFIVVILCVKDRKYYIQLLQIPLSLFIQMLF